MIWKNSLHGQKLLIRIGMQGFIEQNTPRFVETMDLVGAATRAGHWTAYVGTFEQ